MTLVERLHRYPGPDDGPYQWSVEVWRADTTALANLRVVLEIHRIKRRSLLPDGRRRLYREVETATRERLKDGVREMAEKGRQLVERFEDDRMAAKATAGGVREAAEYALDKLDAAEEWSELAGEEFDPSFVQRARGALERVLEDEHP